MDTEEEIPTMQNDEVTPDEGRKEEDDDEKGSQGTPESPAVDVDVDVDVDEPEAKEHPQAAKMDQILDACRRRDIEELQSLAESPGGFVTDGLRQQAWPILLGVPVRFPSDNGDDKPSNTTDDDAVRITASEADDGSWKDLPPHSEEGQVKLDVDRAFVYYPDYQSDEERARQKDELSSLILSVLRRNPYLSYFQGYHDICQVLLLVLPPSLRSPTMARLSTLRIRDFMLPNLKAAISQLRLIPDILQAADPKLWHHLSQTEPFFALSGTLTMYAHDVQSLGEITRLFDVLLAREPVFSVYMFARIVLDRRAELFDTPADEPEMLHSILSKLPQPLDLEGLIARTCALVARHPPEALRSWGWGISPNSVLKTARSTRACAGQSVDVGAYYFAQQVLELQRAEKLEKVRKMMWRYRRPAAAVGFAVAFGVLAYWMRKSSLSAGSLGYMTAVVSRWWHEF
ncbi:GTPase-activating protein gyp10 [Cytospora mali]|uniref:GTPase-activating protein gyp10 n=1 Tax=Cytospora mali TaxID=578113 RepID=A0A194VGF3_CYTMA|nr:GTPase-activating protein gyp10 [Valsa mali var. pyri (nom. inval.)]